MNKPVAFVPTLPEPSQGVKRRKSAKTMLAAKCKTCRRETDPTNNRIVFCDTCSTAYHQYCHNPPIDNEVVTVLEKEWLCAPCMRLKQSVMEGVQNLVAAEHLSIDEVSTKEPCHLCVLTNITETCILLYPPAAQVSRPATNRHNTPPRASRLPSQHPNPNTQPLNHQQRPNPPKPNPPTIPPPPNTIPPRTTDIPPPILPNLPTKRPHPTLPRLLNLRHGPLRSPTPRRNQLAQSPSPTATTPANTTHHHRSRRQPIRRRRRLRHRSTCALSQGGKRAGAHVTPGERGFELACG